MRIGIIDHYLDEFHAHHYVELMQGMPAVGDLHLGLAWQAVQLPDKCSLQDWCAQHGMEPAASLEQVVAESDALLVLAPDDPQEHPALCALPLASGKPVFVDKTFAADLASAEALVARARAHGTPLCSSSALRFDSALRGALSGAARPTRCACRGPGSYQNYAVHQFEMVVCALGPAAQRLRHSAPGCYEVDFGDGRSAAIALQAEADFACELGYADASGETVALAGDFFQHLAEALVAFLRGGAPLAPLDETLAVMALLEAGRAATATPGVWQPVPRSGVRVS